MAAEEEEAKHADLSAILLAAAAAPDGAQQQEQPDLLLALLPHHLPFLPHADRLALAATCQSTQKQVEEYCENALKILLENHPDKDDTFEQRLRDPSLSRSLTTTMPAEMPFRYLLWAARKTYLYKIKHGRRDNNNNNEDGGGGGNAKVVHSLVLFPAPSEDRIAIGTSENNVEVWSLSTKQRLHTLQHSSPDAAEEERLQRVFFVDGRLVSCSSRRIRVWSATGASWSNSITFDSVGPPENREILHGWVPNEQKHQLLFFAVDARRGIGSVDYLDLRDGSMYTLLFRCDNGSSLFVVNGRWLVVCVRMRKHDNRRLRDPWNDGLYVIDPHFNRMVQVEDHPCDIWQILQRPAQPSSSDESSKQFAAIGPLCHHVSILDMDDDGRLSKPFGFYTPQHERTLPFKTGVRVDHDGKLTVEGEQRWYPRIAAFYQSRVIIFDDVQGKFVVYNTETGNQERSFACLDELYGLQDERVVVSKNRNEMLVQYREDVGVAAYCLEEPRL